MIALQLKVDNGSILLYFIHNLRSILYKVSKKSIQKHKKVLIFKNSIIFLPKKLHILNNSTIFVSANKE